MDDGGVADVMAVVVVDRFEAIDVQRQDRERDALHLQRIQRLLQAAAVEQAGQRIGAAGAVERADAVLQCVEAVQHRLLELGDLEVPRADAADVVDRVAGVLAALHVARQLPQRHRDAPGEPPGDQQRQQAERIAFQITAVINRDSGCSVASVGRWAMMPQPVAATGA
jgi:hypothetical protein